MLKKETAMNCEVDIDRKLWFSMWFLGAIVTFGLAFFPMFYRLVENRNNHFQREMELEKQIENYLKSKGKQSPAISKRFGERNSKAWATSIILVVPVFAILYLLSKDLLVHESQQEAFLASAFPKRMFMGQTIPIRKYILITIITLGVGTVYWFYKVVNLYNAHYKAHLYLQNEVAMFMENERVVEHL
jgi:hypothetical protein